MASLTATALCVFCAAQPATASQNMMRWQPIIAEAATRFALPADWIARVMEAESGGQTTLNDQPIKSKAGAMGLMQVMPDTYETMRVTYRLGADPYDPHDNILAGAAYLRLLYQRYGYPNLFAAYNAGPARFDDFLYRDRSLPAETTAYIARVLHSSSGLLTGGSEGNPAPSNTPLAPADELFFVGDGTRNPTPNASPTNRDLFVPLSSSRR